MALSYPGVAKADFSVAMAISQLATNWQPAAVANPETWAITGTGRSWEGWTKERL